MEVDDFIKQKYYDVMCRMVEEQKRAAVKALAEQRQAGVEVTADHGGAVPIPIHDQRMCVPTANRLLKCVPASVVEAGAHELEVHSNSASSDLGIVTSTRCSMESTNGSTGLFPSMASVNSVRVLSSAVLTDEFNFKRDTTVEDITSGTLRLHEPVAATSTATAALEILRSMAASNPAAPPAATSTSAAALMILRAMAASNSAAPSVLTATSAGVPTEALLDCTWGNAPIATTTGEMAITSVTPSTCSIECSGSCISAPPTACPSTHAAPSCQLPAVQIWIPPSTFPVISTYGDAVDDTSAEDVFLDCDDMCPTAPMPSKVSTFQLLKWLSDCMLYTFAQWPYQLHDKEEKKLLDIYAAANQATSWIGSQPICHVWTVWLSNLNGGFSLEQLWDPGIELLYEDELGSVVTSVEHSVDKVKEIAPLAVTCGLHHSSSVVENVLAAPYSSWCMRYVKLAIRRIQVCLQYLQLQPLISSASGNKSDQPFVPTAVRYDGQFDKRSAALAPFSARTMQSSLQVIWHQSYHTGNYGSHSLIPRKASTSAFHVASIANWGSCGMSCSQVKLWSLGIWILLSLYKFFAQAAARGRIKVVALTCCFYYYIDYTCYFTNVRADNDYDYAAFLDCISCYLNPFNFVQVPANNGYHNDCSNSRGRQAQ